MTKAFTCKKTKYATKEFAEQGLEKIIEKSDKKFVPKRVYFCPRCECYHLTSKVSPELVFLEKEVGRLKTLLEENKAKADTTYQMNNRLKNQEKRYLDLEKRNTVLLERMEYLRTDKYAIDKFFAVLSSKSDKREILEGIENHIKRIKNVEEN